MMTNAFDPALLSLADPIQIVREANPGPAVDQELMGLFVEEVAERIPEAWRRALERKADPEGEFARRVQRAVRECLEGGRER